MLNLRNSDRFIKEINKIVACSGKSYLFVVVDFLKLYKQKGITTEEYFQFEFEKRMKNSGTPF